MFSLKEQNAKLSNLNLRAELHGEEHKIACDLQFEIKVSNDVLSEFDASLKSAIYRAADAGDAPIDDMFKDQPGYLPKIKFPLMSPFKWGYENAGYAVTVHLGVSGKADILMILCKVDKFRFDCQDGGTVIVCFRVIAHPEPDDIGRLSEMIQQELSITLQPPSADEVFQQQMKSLEEDDDD